MAENSGDLSLGYMMGQDAGKCSNDGNGGFMGGWGDLAALLIVAGLFGWGGGGFGGAGGFGGFGGGSFGGGGAGGRSSGSFLTAERKKTRQNKIQIGKRRTGFSVVAGVRFARLFTLCNLYLEQAF